MPDDCAAWSTAWDDAAVGDHGFYRSSDGWAERTFETDVTAGSTVATRIVDVALDRLTMLLSQHPVVTVTDVGAGNGLLLLQVMSLLPRPVVDRLQWRALDVRPRPDDVDERIVWIAGDARVTTPRLGSGPGMVIAHEFLDDIACDVLEVDDEHRRRLVLVHHDGTEVLGPPLEDQGACAALGVDGSALSSWCERWWSRREPAARVEVGSSRDRAWSSIAGMVDDGLAIAVDYAHVEADRARGLWDGGTLTGYRSGRLVRPVPDGSCNLTAHVAIDSCAGAVAAASTTLEPSGVGDDLWWLIHSMGR